MMSELQLRDLVDAYRRIHETEDELQRVSTKLDDSALARIAALEETLEKLHVLLPDPIDLIHNRYRVEMGHATRDAALTGLLGSTAGAHLGLKSAEDARAVFEFAARAAAMIADAAHGPLEWHAAEREPHGFFDPHGLLAVDDTDSRCDVHRAQRAVCGCTWPYVPRHLDPEPAK